MINKPLEDGDVWRGGGLSEAGLGQAVSRSGGETLCRRPFRFHRLRHTLLGPGCVLGLRLGREVRVTVGLWLWFQICVEGFTSQIMEDLALETVAVLSHRCSGQCFFFSIP